MSQAFVPRRQFVELVAASALLLCVPGRAWASTPIDDLKTSADFRVRMSSALLVGRAKVPGARAALEAALGDSHPAVRAAAASALVELGDAKAVAALETQARREDNADVQSTLLSSAASLRQASGKSKAKYVVEVGTIRNMSTVKSTELPTVLRGAAKQVAMSRLEHAAVIDESESGLLKQASFRKLPVLRLDGQLRSLQQGGASSQLTMRAQVEFAVLRNQALKATFSGTATAGGMVNPKDPLALFQLQKKAVEHAVASAMGSAEAGFRAAL